MSAPPGPRAARRVGLALLFAYLVVLACFLLLPTAAPAATGVGWGRAALLALGAPGEVLTPARAEWLANVAVFVPPLALVAVLWPRLRWRTCVLSGLAASAGVEAAQAVLFAGRSATVRDLVANTVGSAVGAGIGVWLRRRSDAVRQRG